MTKKNKTPLGIFTESIGLYFSNFDKFVKYMTFPVLGQVCGLILVFLLTLLYTKHIPQNLDFNFLILLSIAVTLPGMIIFVKAFWEYLVSYGAINSMLDNMLKSGKVYDFDAHTELIKRRTVPFVGLWFLFGIFSMLAIIPFFWVPAGVIAIFCVLIFQVFTFEPELSPIGCVKKSMLLIKGHFASTFLLMALVGVLTYVFVSQIIISLCEVLRISEILTNLTIPLVEALPVAEVNQVLAVAYLPPLKTIDIASFFVTTLIAQIFIQYTLPLRSILWSMWYKELNGGKCNWGGVNKGGNKVSSTKKKKRPSEKLMDASHKKLDRNILKRAMEKDDEGV